MSVYRTPSSLGYRHAVSGLNPNEALGFRGIMKAREKEKRRKEKFVDVSERRTGGLRLSISEGE